MKKIPSPLLVLIGLIFILNGCAPVERPQEAVSSTPSVLDEESQQQNSGESSSPLADVSYEYQIQELNAKRDENQIYGEIFIPQNAGDKMPAVIFSHGFGGTYTVGTQYAQALAQKGYVVCCFDFCGGSPSSQSGGSTLEMSLFTEQADLEAVISTIQNLDFVDSENLFLMGTSQGGVVSAITGAAHPGEIRGMVLLYPAFILSERTNELFQNVDEIPDTYYFMWMEVGRAYFEPLIGYDIYEEIATYDRDVLLIHGDADTIVPLSYSERALDVYPSAELKVIPNGGHGFHGANAQQTIEYMLEYFEAHRV